MADQPTPKEGNGATGTTTLDTGLLPRQVSTGTPEGSLEKQKTQPNWEGMLPIVFGFTIWMVIIGSAVYSQFRSDGADLLLDVSRDLTASGRVLYGGTATSAGLVHVALDDPRSQRRIASAVAEVKDGSFTTQPLTADAQSANAALPPPPLKVTAHYFGQVKVKDTLKNVGGEAVVYVNAGPPLGASAWWVSLAALVSLFILISVFTSRAGMRRVRMLFQVMYLITFLSLVLPIMLTMALARNPYLVEMMKETPIGLVNAKTSGAKDAQWLINIGGTVISGDSAKTAAPAMTAKSGTIDNSGPLAGTNVAVVAASSQGTGQQGPDLGPRVSGGIAVPLYLVLLAMFGAAVNLTRRVPEIQKKAESLKLGDDMGLLEAPFRLLFGQPGQNTTTESRESWADIRRELVQNYMYLLSAPVLAVAVYYILQIVANEVTQPVLVLGSFAAGLASESIIKYVMDFADDKFKYAAKKDGT